MPDFANRSKFGVAISPPNDPISEYPKSSAKITNIFGFFTFESANAYALEKISKPLKRIDNLFFFIIFPNCDRMNAYQIKEFDWSIS